MKYKNSIFFALFCQLIFILTCCAPQPCSKEIVAAVKANFYRTGTGTSIKADTVTLYGIGNDTTKIYDKATSLTGIAIPLDAGSDSCSLYIRLNTYEDTVTLYYTNYPHLLSKECGYTYYHILTSIKHKKPVLDYNIMNQTITTLNEENVRIFY
jgi:hypothetical protein